tara:strand:+ start:1019 stop:1186 length:168 start_codon:yes stop_codon:yes gene_type:complete
LLAVVKVWIKADKPIHLFFKIKVMFKTDAVIDLWVGVNGGHINIDEYYEMLNLLN